MRVRVLVQAKNVAEVLKAISNGDGFTACLNEGNFATTNLAELFVDLAEFDISDIHLDPNSHRADELKQSYDCVIMPKDRRPTLTGDRKLEPEL
jgi:hypothetical protein